MARRSRIIAWLLALVFPIGSAAADDVLVFAAASTKTALDSVALAFEDATEHDVTLSYAGSSALARQITQGAPAGVFVSASEAWMDEVEEAGWVQANSRVTVVRNRLALIARSEGAGHEALDAIPNIAEALGGGRLAMALVEAVPAGIYGKAALQSLGQWDSVEPLVAQADNVRAALQLVAIGAAPMGIVYASDLQAEPRVTLVALFPADSHPPIRYPAAVLKSGGAGAFAFVDFLQSDTAQALFKAQGFLMSED